MRCILPLLEVRSFCVDKGECILRHIIMYDSWEGILFSGAKLKFEAVEITSASGYALSSTQFSVGSSVSFVDVTVTPPQVTTNIDSRYSMRSPTDFFYPFIWATSDGCHTTIHSFGGGCYLFFLFVLLIFQWCQNSSVFCKAYIIWLFRCLNDRLRSNINDFDIIEV